MERDQLWSSRKEIRGSCYVILKKTVNFLHLFTYKRNYCFFSPYINTQHMSRLEYLLRRELRNRGLDILMADLGGGLGKLRSWIWTRWSLTSTPICEFSESSGWLRKFLLKLSVMRLIMVTWRIVLSFSCLCNVISPNLRLIWFSKDWVLSVRKRRYYSRTEAEVLKVAHVNSEIPFNG